MVTTEPEVPQGGAVRTQLVGGHPLRREAAFSQQLAHQLDGRAAVSPALKQHVEDLAFMVDRAPEIHPPSGDPDHHLVEVPYVDGRLLAKDFGRFLIRSLALICPAFCGARTRALAKMVSATRVPNSDATLNDHRHLRNVSRLGSIDHTIYSSPCKFRHRLRM